MQRYRSPSSPFLRSLALCSTIFSLSASSNADPFEPQPNGRPFSSLVERPQIKTPALCSFKYPICVHAAKDSALSLLTLNEAEKALFALSLQTELPPLLPDFSNGTTPALDLYLHETAGPWYQIGADPPESIPYDRASVFGLISPKLTPGCTLQTAVHRTVATALLAATDIGETPGFFAGSAAYLAGETTGCRLHELAGIDDAQTHPERSLFSTTSWDSPDASPLLPWFFDAAYSNTDAPAGLLLSTLWRGAQQKTPADATTFFNDRDAFTTLTAIAKGRNRTLPDLLLDLAVGRAFLGDRNDGQHVVDSTWSGQFGRVRFDASFAFNTLPRRIAFSPLEPTGSTYTWVDLTGAPPKAGVIVRAEWERPLSLRWAVVRIGHDGNELSRIEIPVERGVYSVERSIVELESTAGLLVVGVSVGDPNGRYMFNPDTPKQPLTGGTVTVFKEQ